MAEQGTGNGIADEEQKDFEETFGEDEGAVQSEADCGDEEQAVFATGATQPAPGASGKV